MIISASKVHCRKDRVFCNAQNLTLCGAGFMRQTRVGWTVGGGLEWMFMPNWSLKGEYLYYDLGSLAWNNTPIVHDDRETAGAQVINNSSTSMSFNGHIVRAGINYHFNVGDLATVVAKY
jgi:outer membrane immunogenic protein